jgi:hypothetical protein
MEAHPLSSESTGRLVKPARSLRSRILRLMLGLSAASPLLAADAAAVILGISIIISAAMLG